jgi:hypothetical protein
VVNLLTSGTPCEAGTVSPTPERYIAETAGSSVPRELEKTVDSSYKAMRGEKLRMSGISLAGMIEQHPEAILIRPHDQLQRDLAKLNKLAVKTIDNPEGIKAIDVARIETMKSLNAVVEDMEQASSMVTLGQKLRGAVRKQELATQ